MINLVRDEASYDVFYNTKLIGSFSMDVDGFYYYYPNIENNGHWSSYQLKEIANKLDEVNKDWEEHINDYFKNE